ncbi:MAG: ribonuclease J [Rhodospirillaceae bacterium]
MTEIRLPLVKNAPPDAVWFLPLGGTGEIGMNLNVYGCDGKWIAVDMGVTFGDDSIPGVDVVMADPLFLEEQAKDLLAIVITHAHEDHLGAVGYLWPDLRVPVYATPFAAAFLEYKLKEERLDKDVPVNVVPLGGRVEIGPFDIEFVSMTHSIPEPNLLAIRTRHGTIIHTGDWKLDPEPLIGEEADTKRLREIGDEGVLAVISDSTNILNKGHSGSEGEVRRSLVEEFKKYPNGKIAVACFASNVARVESVAHAAHANGRKVVLVGRSLWRILETSRKAGYLDAAGPFLEAEDARHLPAREICYICTGSQGEPRAALNRIAWGQHPHVELGKGDVCFFSSRVIPGNEKGIFRLHNQLVRNGVQLITDREAFIHVSGHPAQEEVAELYRLLRPRIVVPVHGEARHIREHSDFALNMGVPFTQMVVNGQAVNLSHEGPSLVGQAPIGRLTLEGDRIVPLDSPILRDRKRMVENGAAVITLVMNGKGLLAQDPLVTTHGLFNPEHEDDDDVDAVLVGVVRAAVSRLEARERKDDEAVREAVRRAVRKSFFSDQKRKPLTDVHLVRI